MNDLYIGSQPAILMNGRSLLVKDFVKESNEKIYQEIRYSLGNLLDETNNHKVLTAIYESFTWLGFQDRYLALKYYDYILGVIPSKFEKRLPAIEWKGM